MNPLPNEPQARLRWFQSQNPILYARITARSKSPRFFGILGAMGGVRVPRVPVTSELIWRVGVDTVAGTGCLPPSVCDNQLTNAGITFSEVYNAELLRTLIIHNHLEVARAHTEALQELRQLLTANPARDAQKAMRDGTNFLSIDGYTPETPGCPRLPGEAGHHFIKAFPGLLKGNTEHQLLRRVVDRYVTPFNHYLLTHGKW